jgi:hypothetical protein
LLWVCVTFLRRRLSANFLSRRERGSEASPGTAAQNTDAQPFALDFADQPQLPQMKRKLPAQEIVVLLAALAPGVPYKTCPGIGSMMPLVRRGL